MNRTLFNSMAAGMACLSMVLPPAALAAPPVTGAGSGSPAATAAKDIALRSGGLLVGQVINGQSVGKAGAAVSILSGQHEVVRTTTDANGVFAAKGLRGGQYLIVTPEGLTVCRLWAEGTAPPAATPTAVIVPTDEAVRGQFGVGYGKAWFEWMKSHPYLTAGTVAAAIAIPLAFADDDWNPGS